MPPKASTARKADEKKKEKLIEDKTFGLKVAAPLWWMAAAWACCWLVVQPSSRHGGRGKGAGRCFQIARLSLGCGVL